MVGMMDGEVGDWWDECRADGLTGSMVGLRVGWMCEKMAIVGVVTVLMGG